MKRHKVKDSKAALCRFPRCDLYGFTVIPKYDSRNETVFGFGSSMYASVCVGKIASTIARVVQSAINFFIHVRGKEIRSCNYRCTIEVLILRSD